MNMLCFCKDSPEFTPGEERRLRNMPFSDIFSSKKVKLAACVITILIIVQFILNFTVYKHVNLRKYMFHDYGRNGTVNIDLRHELNTPKYSKLVLTGNSAVAPTIITGSTTTNSSHTNTTVLKNVTLPPCPEVPPNLVGRIKVFLEKPPTMQELEKQHPELEPGGRWRPKHCIARHRVAIVIPYRDREEHLRVFLNNVHPLLQKQQLDYSIVVAEETPGTKFNRAMLMNVGYNEAAKLYDYQCFIFHDVDLIPEDDRNIYSCPKQPRHMSVAIDKFNYRLPYQTLFGGVSALTKAQFQKINGFSNKFFGWGGEDDDMANRVVHYGYKISRYPLDVARYRMISHKGDTPNDDRFRLLSQGRTRFTTDGLNSLVYKRRKLELRPLYTWAYVEINMNEVMKS